MEGNGRMEGEGGGLRGNDDVGGVDGLVVGGFWYGRGFGGNEKGRERENVA